MSSYLKLIFLAGLAVLVGLWWLFQAPQGEALATVSPTARVPGAEVEMVVHEGLGRPESLGTTALGAREPATVRRQEPVTPSQRDTALVRGRFLDEASLPCVGVRVDSSSVPRRDGKPEGLRTPALSDEDGEFTLEVDTLSSGKLTYEIRWDADSLASGVRRMQLGVGDELSLGAIVLERGATVKGRVLGHFGQPLVGAEVWARSAHLWDAIDWEAELSKHQRETLATQGDRWGGDLGPWSCQARTDERGIYCLKGVPAGRPVRVWAKAHAMRFQWSNALHLGTKEVLSGVNCNLEPFRAEDRIVGRVVGPGDRPVAHAIVAYRPSDDAEAKLEEVDCDVNGHFEILVAHRGRHDLSVIHPVVRASVGGVMPGAPFLTIR